MDTTTSYSHYEYHSSGMGIVPMLILLALSVFFIAAMWKINTKAGKPGWAAIVPIYGTIVLLEIAGKPMWWFILMFIPIVSLVIAILTMAGLANSFGKSGGFVVGLILLPFIFLPILAFGSAQYVGPGGMNAMGGQLPQARVY